MPTKVSLYYANWCGHCNTFKPEWEALKNTLDQLNIEHDEFEESQNKKEVAEASIKGFPTIRISKDNSVYEYRGPRTAPDILYELGVQPQVGGGFNPNVDWKTKYLKYKNKYLDLKHL